MCIISPRLEISGFFSFNFFSFLVEEALIDNRRNSIRPVDKDLDIVFSL